LEVNGGNGSETFTIADNGTRVRFDRVDPAPFTIDAGTMEKIVVNANGGDDFVNASALTNGAVTLTLDGGAGADTLAGSAGADTLVGSDGNDIVAGRQGNDVALLGAGDDVFFWNPGDGNDTVEGGDGFDKIGVRGADVAETFAISANGTRALLTRDVANVALDLNQVERIEIQAAGGKDSVTVNDLSGTGVTQVD